MKTLLHACTKALPATAGWLLAVWLPASVAPLPARGQFLNEATIEKSLQQKQKEESQQERLNRQLKKIMEEHSFPLSVAANQGTNKIVQFEADSLFIVQSTAKPGKVSVDYYSTGIRTTFSGMAVGTRMVYTFSVRNIGKETLQVQQPKNILGGGIWEYSRQPVPPGGLLTFTVRNLSVPDYGHSSNKIYLQTNQGTRQFTIELYAEGQEIVMPPRGQMTTHNKLYVPWNSKADSQEQVARERHRRQQQQARQAEQAERLRAHQAHEAVLADTVYPYSTKKLPDIDFQSFNMDYFAYANNYDDEINYAMNIMDKQGEYAIMFIGMINEYNLFDNEDYYNLIDEIKADSRTTDNKSNSTCELNDYPMALRLANGESLSTTANIIYYCKDENDKIQFAFGLQRLDSDRKNLARLGKMQRHAYVVTRLSRYNVESITLGNYTFKLGDVRTANTLKAMFADAEKATGDTGKYHYTEPSAQATPAASTQPSESGPGHRPKPTESP